MNPIFAMVDPIPYYSSYTHMFMFVNLLIANAGCTRNSQLKTDLR